MSISKKIIQGEINKLTPRAAMGLPEHYQPPKVTHSRASFQDAIETEEVALLEQLEDPATALDARMSAALMLALTGDSRIRCFDPLMVTVPAASVRLGLSQDRVDELFQKYETYGVQRSWIEKECPQFDVDLAAFRIGAFPVTNQEYELFLRCSPERAAIPTAWPDGIVPKGLENHPVYTVTAEAADAYAAWLSQKTGRKFRLPTEYEWEYTAAGAAGHDYPWGNTFDETACNTLELGVLTTTAVGIFPEGRSWCGAYDMAGNVEEYVQTSYHSYPGGAIVHDDLYDMLGAYRIARGGAFNRFQDLARCQRRHGPYPNSLYAMGFRLAEEIEG